MARDDMVAAPPDDGGHEGVFSRPDDELSAPDGSHRHPPTDQDPAEPGGRGSVAAALGWGLAFLVITMFFIWAYGIGC